jgi:D-serine deaminase-like pyridoxal phosphate-dependent protein
MCNRRRSASVESARRACNAPLFGVRGGARQLATPALTIDLPKMRANLAWMNRRCAAANLRLRPHGKTHKCSAIAREQLAAGAVGICAASPHEVIAFARAGVRGLLLTAPVAQPAHFAALAELHRCGAELMVVIDHPDGVAAWSKALGRTQRELPVLVDVDLGMGRTGARSAREAVAIARGVAGAASLAHAGVQAYSGRVQHIERYGERRRVYLDQIQRLAAALRALDAAGLGAKIVSGGGTGTFAIDLEHGLYTESQAGSYLFMDVEYNDVELFPGWRNPYSTSLLMRTSVLSANVPGQVTINAGFKCFATDGPEPRLHGALARAARYEFFGDEYGRVVLRKGRRAPKVGEYIELVTPHCDPTVNLHDFYHVLAGDTLIDIWPIDARGVS